MILEGAVICSLMNHQESRIRVDSWNLRQWEGPSFHHEPRVLPPTLCAIFTLNNAVNSFLFRLFISLGWPSKRAVLDKWTFTSMQLCQQLIKNQESESIKNLRRSDSCCHHQVRRVLEQTVQWFSSTCLVCPLFDETSNVLQILWQLAHDPIVSTWFYVSAWSYDGGTLLAALSLDPAQGQRACKWDFLWWIMNCLWSDLKWMLD